MTPKYQILKKNTKFLKGSEIQNLLLPSPYTSKTRSIQIIFIKTTQWRKLNNILKDILTKILLGNPMSTKTIHLQDLLLNKESAKQSKGMTKTKKSPISTHQLMFKTQTTMEWV